MICRYCDLNKTLIKAHIIPEFFFKKLRGNDMLLKVSAGERPKSSPIGAYDTRILCGSCDGRFSSFESYSANLLTDPPQSAVEVKEQGLGKRTGYVIPNYNYKLLKLFFLSVMWRASISTLPFYSKISLGPYEERIRALLEAECPGEKNEFPIVISKFSGDYANAIFNPYTSRIGETRFCIFHMGSYVVRIKVDARISKYEIPNWVLSPNNPLFIPERDFLESRESAKMHHLLAASNSLRARRT